MIGGDIYGYRTSQALANLVDAMEVEATHRLGNKLRGWKRCGSYRAINQEVEALGVELSIFGCGIVIYLLNSHPCYHTHPHIPVSMALFIHILFCNFPLLVHEQFGPSFVRMGNLAVLKAKLREIGYDGDGDMVVGAVISPEVIVHLISADMHITIMLNG